MSCLKAKWMYIFSIVCFLNNLTAGAQKEAVFCLEKNAIINQHNQYLLDFDTAAAVGLAKDYLSKTNICKSTGFFITIWNTIDKKDTLGVEKLLQEYKNYLDSKKADSILYADYYTMMAKNLIFLHSGHADALQYQFKAIALLEESRDTMILLQNLFWTSVTFYRMNDFDNMMKYGSRGIQLLSATHDYPKKAELLAIGSSIYYLNYDHNARPGLLDTALDLANNALATARKFNNKAAALDAFACISAVHARRKEQEDDLRFQDSILINAIPYKHDKQIAGAYQSISAHYRKLEDYDKAALYADSAMPYFRRYGFATLTMSGLFTVYKANKLAGNYQRALEALEEKTTLSDSLLNLEKTKKINELEKKYTQVKNEKTIKELNQQKQFYIMLAITALLALAIIWFLLRQQNLKQKQKILEAEQRLNRARMNPHFFFNALSSLQQYALEEHDGKLLAINLSRFSHIMRETLESTYKDYVTVEQEIDFLSEYLELQKMRYQEKFTYSIEAHAELEIDDILIPSMIIQPFAENAIEHGFRGIEEMGILSIKFSSAKDEMIITIDDNGTGLSDAKKITEDHISRASQIIKDRIYLLNIKLKTNARFSIQNKTGEQGVQVKIFLPVIFNHENINS